MELIMCGRYHFSIEEKDLRDIVTAAERNIANQSKFAPFAGGEVYPSNSVPVITAYESKYMTWGYPSLADGRPPHINARSETAATKNTFKAAMATRRCVIPASCFYEWKALANKRQKEKYEFSMLNDDVMYMAGIYSLDNRFAILTREATPDIAEIHNRMPVVVPKDLIGDWLSGSDEVLQKAVTDLKYTPILPPDDDDQPTQMSLF